MECVTIAATLFDYNALGDVTKIARADGVFLQYTYDDDRRVTKVQDNSGATIEYDRDSLGNVTARRIKDLSGILQLSQTSASEP